MNKMTLVFIAAFSLFLIACPQRQLNAQSQISSESSGSTGSVGSTGTGTNGGSVGANGSRGNTSSPGMGDILTPGMADPTVAPGGIPPEPARPGMGPMVRTSPSPTASPGVAPAFPNRVPGSMGSGSNPGATNVWPAPSPGFAPTPTGTPGFGY